MPARAMTDRAVAPGFFGKLPSRGDFVGRGLAAATIAAWDGWISQCLTASRALLTEDWIAAWTAAPIWHFELPPGQCGPAALAGVLAPSMDRVGRHFPLIVAVELPAVLRGEGGVNEAYHDALEEACRHAVSHDLAPEAFSAQLAAIPAPDTAPSTIGVWWTKGGENVAPTTFECGALPDAGQFSRMLHD